MNEIKTRDAGLIFVFSVFFMTIVASILLLILKGIVPTISGTDWYYMANYFFSQASFFLAILIFANFRKLKFRNVGLNKEKVSPWIFLIVIAISLIMTFGLNDINILFIQLINTITGFVPVNITLGSKSAINIILSIFLIGLAPAFVEELLIRGFVLTGLRKGYSAFCSVLLSAFMFAIMHLNVGQLLYQFIFGIIIATLAVLTRSLYASMVLHALNNLIVLVVYFVGGSTSGSDVGNIVYSAGEIVGAIALAILSLVVIFGLLLLVGYFVKRGDHKREVPPDIIDMGEEKAQPTNKVFGWIKDTFTYFTFRMSEKPIKTKVEINVVGRLLDENLGDLTRIEDKMNKVVLWICIGGFIVVYVLNLFMQKAA